MKPSTDPSSPAPRVRRIFHELRRREVKVVRTEQLSPNFLAVTFGGDSLEGFISASFDDHVKFMLEDDAGNSVRRDYTPRRFDPVARELTIEFGLHAGGRAAAWAMQTKPGQTAVIGGPRGSMLIPDDYAWHLLAGDAAALPAIHRRLEELPPAAKAIVMVQLTDPADRREFHAGEQVQVHWFSTPGGLVDALHSMPLPHGDGFVWCAGEASLMARLRRIVQEEKCHPRHCARIAAYWKQGESDFHESLVNPAEEPPNS